VTVLACWGALLIGALYMLRAVRALLHGPMPVQWDHVKDACGLWRRMPFVLLIAALLLFGFFPGLLAQKIVPSVQTQILARFTGPALTHLPVSSDMPAAASAAEAPASQPAIHN
jgi:NADH:ubiquinone oxidoreductase subunit 4 (subunit M)